MFRYFPLLKSLHRVLSVKTKIICRGDGTARSVARLVSQIAAHFCRVGLSPAGDIKTKLCVNNW